MYREVSRGIKRYQIVSSVLGNVKSLKDTKSIIDCINGINNIIRLVMVMLGTLKRHVRILDMLGNCV